MLGKLNYIKKLHYVNQLSLREVYKKCLLRYFNYLVFASKFGKMSQYKNLVLEPENAETIQ